MDPEFILDIADRSSVERIGINQYRATRGCAVVGIEITPTDTPWDLLFKVERELFRVKGIRYNDPHPSPNVTNCYLNRIVIEGGNDTGPVGARFALIYEPFTSNINTALLVSVGGSVTSHTFQRIPGTDMEFELGFTTDKDPSNYIPVDVGTANLKIPTPQITVFRRQVGTLSEDMALRAANCLGLVNGDSMAAPQGSGQILLPPALGGGGDKESTWMGRQQGSWMITQFQSEMDVYGGSFSQRITAEAAGTPDMVYDQFFRMRGRTMGKIAQGPEYNKQKSNDMKAPYKYGYITDPTKAQMNGFLRVGCYRTTPFGPLLGFGAGNSGILGINNPSPQPGPHA